MTKEIITELQNAVFPKMFHKETVAMTDSLKVAYYFGKQHKNIIQSIKNLGCSDEFNRLNFQPVKYVDEKGEKRPMYRMTYDGFTLLVMGFTGKRAMLFKEQYIKDFNKMKSWIMSKQKLSSDQQRLNQAIKSRLDYLGKDDPHAYSRENNLVYLVALGFSRKKWLTEQGYPPEVEIRQYLTSEQIQLVDDLLVTNAVMIGLGMDYQERKDRLQEQALGYFRKHLIT